MASLSGVHITFGYTDSTGAPLPYFATSSETMSIATVSIVSAPHAPTPDQSLDRNVAYLPLLSISASAPIFYCTGPDPMIDIDAKRYMDPTFGREDVFVNPGDFFAWEFV